MRETIVDYDYYTPREYTQHVERPLPNFSAYQNPKFAPDPAYVEKGMFYPTGNVLPQNNQYLPTDMIADKKAFCSPEYNLRQSIDELNRKSYYDKSNSNNIRQSYRQAINYNILY